MYSLQVIEVKQVYDKNLPKNISYQVLIPKSSEYNYSNVYSPSTQPQRHPYLFIDLVDI